MILDEVKSILYAMSYLIEEQESNRSMEHISKLARLDYSMKQLFESRADSLEEIIQNIDDKNLKDVYYHVKNHMRWK